MPPVAANQVSIYDIADATGYSPAAIHKAIERFGYMPEYVTPGGARYFSHTLIEILKEKMRKHNCNGSKR
jgi:hypothetical protein